METSRIGASFCGKLLSDMTEAELQIAIGQMEANIEADHKWRTSPDRLRPDLLPKPIDVYGKGVEALRTELASRA